MKTYLTMLKTEIKLSIRDMNMIIFALINPIIVLVVLAIVNGNKPAYDGAIYNHVSQSFSSIITISILAGGVMGLPIVISDYRSKKILKRFEVNPKSWTNKY